MVRLIYAGICPVCKREIRASPDGGLRGHPNLDRPYKAVWEVCRGSGRVVPVRQLVA